MLDSHQLQEKASRTFQLRSDTMMTLHRTGSDTCTSQMTSDAFKINGDATEIIKHFYQEAVESISLMYLGAWISEQVGPILFVTPLKINMET